LANSRFCLQLAAGAFIEGNVPLTFGVGIAPKKPCGSVMPIVPDCRFMPCESAPRRERMPGGQVVEEMMTWHG
jgi:hypothetical protein